MTTESAAFIIMGFKKVIMPPKNSIDMPVATRKGVTEDRKANDSSSSTVYFLTLELNSIPTLSEIFLGCSRKSSSWNGNEKCAELLEA